jgi:hypothetical protein
MFKWSIALFDRIFSVGGAIVFSQFPQFMQQYTQRLSGHLSELDLQVKLMQNAAEASSLSLNAYIQKFLQSNSEPAFNRQGEIMQQVMDRFQNLSAALKSFQDASLYKRPFVFITHLNGDIAGDTWTTFQPGIPTTLEGLVYAFVGMLAGIIFFYAIRKFLSSCFNKLFRKNRKMQTPLPTKTPSNV